MNRLGLTALEPCAARRFLVQKEAAEKTNGPIRCQKAIDVPHEKLLVELGEEGGHDQLAFAQVFCALLVKPKGVDPRYGDMLCIKVLQVVI